MFTENFNELLNLLADFVQREVGAEKVAEIDDNVGNDEQWEEMSVFVQHLFGQCQQFVECQGFQAFGALQ